MQRKLKDRRKNQSRTHLRFYKGISTHNSTQTFPKLSLIVTGQAKLSSSGVYAEGRSNPCRRRFQSEQFEFEKKEHACLIRFEFVNIIKLHSIIFHNMFLEFTIENNIIVYQIE